MKQLQYFENKNINYLILTYSLPIALNLIGTIIYLFINRIYLGQGYGVVAIASITLIFPITIIQSALNLLIGAGAGSLISIKLGEKNKDEAEKILGNAFILVIILYLCFTIFGLVFANSILHLLGANSEIFQMVKIYYQIIVLGSIFQGIALTMINFIKSEGNPLKAMWLIILSIVLNMILDPILIFYFKLGIAGAGIATVISQFVLCLMVLKYFFSEESYLQLKLKSMILNPVIVKSVLFLGFGAFFGQFISSFLNILFNYQVSFYGGTIALSVIGILFIILRLIYIPIFAIAQGSQPLISYNFGKKSFDLVNLIVRRVLFFTTIVGFIGFLVIQIFPKEIFLMFNFSDDKFIQIGVPALRIFLLMLPIVSIQIVATVYFESINKPVLVFLSTCLRQIFILLPALLILPYFFGITGIWFAGPVSDFIASVIMGALLLYWMLKGIKK